MKACGAAKCSLSRFQGAGRCGDLNYFKYEFIKPCALSCDEELLEDDFEKLAGRLADASVQPDRVYVSGFSKQKYTCEK